MDVIDHACGVRLGLPTGQLKVRPTAGAAGRGGPSTPSPARSGARVTAFKITGCGLHLAYALGVAGLLGAGGAGGVARGQVMVVNGTVVTVGGAGDDAQNQPTGFTVPRADTKTADALDDFDRYAEKKSWELAFRTVNGLMDSSSAAMISAGDGFLLPLKRRAAQSLVRLSPEGRDAFRLFYDAKAKQLFDVFADPTKPIPADEIASLRRIVDQYLVTSVGDRAADRLGDACFEQGDFAEAEALWKTIVRDLPDTHLDTAQLQAKRALAMSRLGRWDEIAALAGQVKTLAGAEVTIGGVKMPVEQFIASLKAPAPATATAEVAQHPVDIALPADATAPVWQVQVLSPTVLEDMDNKIRTSGWYYYGIAFGGTLPPAKVDDARAYVNFLGTVYAADLKTGKLLWRTAGFTGMADKAINFIQNAVGPDRFALAVYGKNVYAVSRLVAANMSSNEGWRLTCMDGQTGKQKWSSDTLGGGLDFVGEPYLYEGTLYALAVTGGAMNLLALQPETGKQDWRLSIGTPRANTNFRGGMDFAMPVMVGAGGTLYVCTNNGALLAVNTGGRRLEWAFQNETSFVSGERVFNGEMSAHPFTIAPDAAAARRANLS